MLAAEIIRDVRDVCAETGFESLGWIREGKVLEVVYDGYPEFSADVILLEGYSVCPRGYPLESAALVRAKINYFADYLRRATGKKVVVEMINQELQDSLTVLYEAIKDDGLDFDADHGFDGHLDAIGIIPAGVSDFPDRAKSFCLRFEGDKFRLHGWCALELEIRVAWTSLANKIADALESATGKKVEVK